MLLLWSVYNGMIHDTSISIRITTVEVLNNTRTLRREKGSILGVNKQKVKLGGFRIFLQTHTSPRPPSRVEHFGALIGRARGSHHVVISYRK